MGYKGTITDEQIRKIEADWCKQGRGYVIEGHYCWGVYHEIFRIFNWRLMKSDAYFAPAHGFAICKVVCIVVSLFVMSMD